MRIGRKEGKWFPLKESWVEAGMSYIAIGINMIANGLRRKVSARVSKEGLEIGVGKARFELNQLLFANDAMLMADSENLFTCL